MKTVGFNLVKQLKILALSTIVMAEQCIEEFGYLI